MEEKAKAAQQQPEPKIEEPQEWSAPQSDPLVKEEEEHSSTGEEESCAVAQV